MLVFDINWIAVLTFAIGTLLPLLVGIVTTKVTSPARKAVYLALLSFAASILTEIVNALTSGEAYNVGAGLLAFGAIFVLSVASYFGVWSRPTSSGESISAKLVNSVGRTVDPRDDGSYLATDAPPRYDL